ncbi:transposase [Luxibacter massiliensis]|uniref:transposase n=1 Tax=Luxibacter massiliensis TaxID=2219695 RepID=UPI000F04DA45|nr:transposase [Luxibacter massiliensis]
MPRTQRKESGTGFYHVIARGNNKEEIFKKNSDKRIFMKILTTGIKDYPVTVYAHCIMSNHVHLMLETQFEILPRFMQRINSTFAGIYNGKYDRCGHVFQGRYYSDCIETEEYYWCCLRYIHNNPVKIHLAARPYNYEFSSAREYYEGTSKLLGKDAYKTLKTRFQTSEEFWAFHRLFEEKSFLDTVEDERIHNYERVKNLVERYMFENQIEEVKTLLIVGDKKREFLEQCRKATGLSGRKIENILKTDCKRVSPHCKRD